MGFSQGMSDYYLAVGSGVIAVAINIVANFTSKSEVFEVV